MPETWLCRINGDGFTEEVICETEQAAIQMAAECVSRYVKVKNRIYPASRVIHCDIEKKK